MPSRERVYEVAVDRALSWYDGHPVRSLPLDPGYVWQHIVYGGCFALADVRDTLLEVFGRDEEDVDGRMDGDTALFALRTYNRGRPGPPNSENRPYRRRPARRTAPSR